MSRWLGYGRLESAINWRESLWLVETFYNRKPKGFARAARLR
jgi:hypothetical protein